MKNLNLIDISNKIAELTEEFSELYPKYYIAEKAYMNKYHKILLESSNQYPSQPLRESATQERMIMEPEYEEYHTILPKVTVIRQQLRSLEQISKNISNSNWSEIK